jgi:hypothetical protein
MFAVSLSNLKWAKLGVKKVKSTKLEAHTLKSSNLTFAKIEFEQNQS